MCRTELLKRNSDPNDFGYICPRCGLTHNPKVEDTRSKERVDRVESPFGGVTKPEAGQLETITFIEPKARAETVMPTDLIDDDRIPSSIKNYANMMNAKLVKYQDDKHNLTA